MINKSYLNYNQEEPVIIEVQKGFPISLEDDNGERVIEPLLVEELQNVGVNTTLEKVQEIASLLLGHGREYLKRFGFAQNPKKIIGQVERNVRLIIEKDKLTLEEV